MTKGPSSISTVALAAVGVAFPALFFLRHSFLPSAYTVWSLLLESDLGNAIAALVAVVGYMIEHWNTRRAQRLEAQMQRVSSQSQMLLVPITTHLQALLLGSIYQFIDHQFDNTKKYISIVYDDPDYGSSLLKQYLKSPWAEVATDLRNPETSAFWMGDVLRGTQESTGENNRFFPAVSSPTELPRFLHKALEDCERPSSQLWKSYEAFVRCELLPAIDRVAEIINENGHLMEPVPAKRLEEMFGRKGTGMGQKWTIAPRMFFYSLWLAYARSWHTLISKWDDGDYFQIRPNSRFPCGLLFFNIEGQTIVAGVEKELVGMSQMHGSVTNRI